MNLSFSFTSLRFRVVVSVVSATLLLCVPLAFTESVHIQTFDQDYVADDDLADFRTASGDATLSSVSLVGVSLNESFSSEKTEYTADASVSETTVSAVATHDAASIVMPDDIDSGDRRYSGCSRRRGDRYTYRGYGGGWCHRTGLHRHRFKAGR